MLMTAAKTVLAVPAVFNLYQWLVGAPDCHRRFLAEHVRPQRGERILDIGCGTGASLRFLPAGIDYVGIDISEAYIAHARRLHAGRGTFVAADATRVDFRLEGRFDRAFAFGVLHHLGDREASMLLGNVMAALAPKGSITTIDPCFVDGQHPVAHFLARHDRGGSVRRPEQLQSLFSAIGQPDIAVVHDMLRVPYSQVIARICRT